MMTWLFLIAMLLNFRFPIPCRLSNANEIFLGVVIWVSFIFCILIDLKYVLS